MAMLLSTSCSRLTSLGHVSGSIVRVGNEISHISPALRGKGSLPWRAVIITRGIVATSDNFPTGTYKPNHEEGRGSRYKSTKVGRLVLFVWQVVQVMVDG